MNLTAWIIFLSAVTFTLSQRRELCRKKTAVRWMKIPTEQTKQKTRFPGQWVSFNCAVGASDYAVLWFKKDIKSAEKLRVVDTKIRLVSANTFNITSLTLKDRGFYRCKVCGKLEKPILFLEILEGIANARPIVKKIPDKLVYDIGDEVKLTCRAENTTNGYEIQWYKISSNKELIEMEQSESYWIDDIQHETLLLKSLSAQDMGIYKCKISFDGKYIASEEVNLNLGAVSWKKNPRQQVERKLRFPGKWLLFNCSVNTSENVTLWFQKNRTSEEKLIYKKITLVSNNVFNITRLTYMDMGYYICRVRRLEKQIFLKISEGIHIPGQKRTLISIVVPTALLSMIVVVVACFVLHRRKKIYGGFIPEWEFPRERISFASKLSSGQFGIVWLAEAIGISAFHPRDMLRDREGGRTFSFFNRTTKRDSYDLCKEVTQVAVKVIKENFDRNDLADLKTELKILTYVGENENIVNMLGVCTNGKSSNIWIIIEYCPHGNLREFLRNNRSRYNAEEESFNQDLSQVFGPKNLIYFAWQITKGMEFLTSRKIIYRDLAARNILLGRGYVAKISDFGLARDVQKNQQYLRTSTGLVPFMLKWMAVESIRDSLFTEKSDVWSFGVLLWEIFSLGGTPYPAMCVNEVHQYLLQGLGKRMDPPIHCPQDIYDVMSMCWKENPKDRPNFQSLMNILHKIFGCKEISQASAHNKEIVESSLKVSMKSNVIESGEDDEKEVFL